MIDPTELDQMTEDDILNLIGQGEVFLAQMPAVGAEIEHLRGYLAGRKWAAARPEETPEAPSDVELVE